MWICYHDKTHQYVRGGEVEDVDIDGGPHVLVSENDGNHRQVAGHPHHEDDHIQADEDRLHPGLEDVQLLAQNCRK